MAPWRAFFARPSSVFCVCGTARRRPSRALLFPHSFFFVIALFSPFLFGLCFRLFSFRCVSFFFDIITDLQSTRGRAKGKADLKRECLKKKEKGRPTKEDHRLLVLVVGLAFVAQPCAAPLFPPDKTKKKRQDDEKKRGRRATIGARHWPIVFFKLPLGRGRCRRMSLCLFVP